MSVFAAPQDLETHLVEAIQSFMESAAGERAAAAAREADAGSVIALHVADPDIAVWIDLDTRKAGAGRAEDPAAEVLVDADDLHHLALNQLAPVHIAKAIEERRLDASGAFELPLALLASLDALGEEWRRSLEKAGREDLIELTAPPAAETYAVETTLVRQGHKPPWAGKGKRAVSHSTRREEERAAG
ncbi:MAG: hypothetical protein GEU90_14410 [Gemmatimonas sp.]|nr:hypothetical protein [Gemmatimonas sp.]